MPATTRSQLTCIYQVFLLIDEGTVRQYKADLTDEIEPQINELLERAEKGLKALNRKESLIHTKVPPFELLQEDSTHYIPCRLKQRKLHSQDLLALQLAHGHRTN